MVIMSFIVANSWLALCSWHRIVPTITFKPQQNPARYQGSLLYFTDAEAESSKLRESKRSLELQAGQLQIPPPTIRTTLHGPISHPHCTDTEKEVKQVGWNSSWPVTEREFELRLLVWLPGRCSKACLLPQTFPSALYLASSYIFLVSAHCKPTPAELC